MTTKKQQAAKTTAKKTATPTAPTEAKEKPRAAKKRSDESKIIVICGTVPTTKEGSDRFTCYTAMAEGRNTITVKDYLAKVAGKTRKPQNGRFCLRDGIRGGWAKLEDVKKQAAKGATK
jgi:hypothetical protein